MNTVIQYLPVIFCSEKNGVWYWSADDIECLSIGCGIMGSGGGASPELGKGVALAVWNEGKSIKLQKPLFRLAYRQHGSMHICS